MLLHITTREEWSKAQIKGEYTSPSLRTDGFIHCSTIGQTVDTANLFFKGQKGLMLLCIDENKLESECKFEEAAGGIANQHDPRTDNLFPHVYGPINMAAVIQALPFNPNVKGFFELPEEILNSQK
jgi:uncharacterized protein (DUF952 family)